MDLLPILSGSRHSRAVGPFMFVTLNVSIRRTIHSTFLYWRIIIMTVRTEDHSNIQTFPLPFPSVSNLSRWVPPYLNNKNIIFGKIAIQLSTAPFRIQKWYILCKLFTLMCQLIWPLWWILVQPVNTEILLIMLIDGSDQLPSSCLWRGDHILLTSTWWTECQCF